MTTTRASVRQFPEEYARPRHPFGTVTEKVSTSVPERVPEIPISGSVTSGATSLGSVSRFAYRAVVGRAHTSAPARKPTTTVPSFGQNWSGSTPPSSPGAPAGPTTPGSAPQAHAVRWPRLCGLVTVTFATSEIASAPRAPVATVTGTSTATAARNAFLVAGVRRPGEEAEGRRRPASGVLLVDSGAAPCPEVVPPSLPATWAGAIVRRAPRRLPS